ncbi:interferon gamma receptor 1 isoform X1 [Mastomys coucha]|uniref:interferon gamma receptor 1 isoform X1 n=2 Tax=Mastomys coucha TaxID=35658 RepID=UPI0012615FBE|nr:interferon gamma receptor 1 isoform X1 [Mastomys coucha]
MGPWAAAGRMILPVVLMLSAAGSGALASTEDSEPPSVPVPTNVLIKSYNLNPEVCWEYQSMSRTPIFTVQVKMYPGTWTDACTNISDHCCNIYQQITYPDLSAWARVKAKVGQKESNYAYSEEFIMCRKGKVGPPGLDIRRKEDQLIVHILHPKVIVNGESRRTMFGDGSTCYTFDYTVYVEHNRSGEILQTEHKVELEDCDESLCELNISVSTLNSRYCAAVAGISSFWQVKTEKSKDVCVPLLHEDREDSLWILVVALLIGFTILILAFACWYIKKNPFKRKSIMLPKSLLSVVRSATSETKPESKYSLVTSCQPAVLENETVICEHFSTVIASDNLEQAEHEELSKETKAMAAEGSTSAMTPDSPPTPIQRGSFSLFSSNQSGPGSLTTYHSRNGSDSGLVGSGSSMSDSEFLPNNDSETKMAEQAPVPVRKAPTSSGYDKPHMLVDVLVDGGGKETLIGYRLTGDAQELS